MRFVLSVVFIFSLVFVDDDYYCRLDKIVPEEACSQEGGVCTFEADCPDPTAEKGLCPNQQSQGVECCYGLSVKETRCRKRGGECFTKSQYCNPRIIYPNATDCGVDEKCCILVN
ncbi:hypothetical protein evm_007788 [Chilo suppressalis]|nr:hypothetical protein evm_007788 [Chilo suppressalis]